MRITALMENTPYADGFLAEHGLSLLIETGDRKILFDMGQSDAYLQNAERLNIDLNTVDYAVLSHGHYDHSGGLSAFLSINHHAPVYVSRFAFEPLFAEEQRSIGPDPALKAHPQLVFVPDTLKIDDESSLCSCNDLPRPFVMGSYGLFARHDGILAPDTFLHEQYLVLRENGKTIVISGCSHKGVLNIVNWLHPDVLVGGFHFMKVDPDGPEHAVLDEAAAELKNHPTRYYTCHCTGIAPYAYLKARMGDQLEYLASGQKIVI